MIERVSKSVAAPGTHDRGGMTIVAALAVLAMVSTMALILQLGAVVAGRHRAQAAADLAALAAAGTAEHGVSVACATARDEAARMQVRLLECTLDGWDAVVMVRARIRSNGLVVREVQAVARAGPLDERVH